MCLKNYGWRFIILYRRQRTKPIPKKKKSKKAKWSSEEALQIAEERGDAKERKGKVHPTKCRVPKNNNERQEGLLQRTVHKNRGKQQKGRD